MNNIRVKQQTYSGELKYCTYAHDYLTIVRFKRYMYLILIWELSEKVRVHLEENPLPKI